jgi:peptidoglycan/LPS O-acetylase OafA/YrhL
MRGIYPNSLPGALTRKKQIHYLDGLRGLAALHVLNAHWSAYIFPELLDNHHLIIFVTSQPNLALGIFFLLVLN